MTGHQLRQSWKSPELWAIGGNRREERMDETTGIPRRERILKRERPNKQENKERAVEIG